MKRVVAIMGIMTMLGSLWGCKSKVDCKDVFRTPAGEEVQFHCIKHGSFYMSVGDKWIYIDPVGTAIEPATDYSLLPKADYILVTHEHHDHMDPQAIQDIVKPGTIVIANPAASAAVATAATAATAATVATAATAAAAGAASSAVGDFASAASATASSAASSSVGDPPAAATGAGASSSSGDFATAVATAAVASAAAGASAASSSSGTVMAIGNGQTLTLSEGWTVSAVPAYNYSADKLNFHPKGRDNGYILDFGGFRVYVAGDTEDIPEMAEIKDIDIAFLPCNLPYTMSVEQCAAAARTISPRVLFPYHYGQTRVEDLCSLLCDSGIEVRIRQYK